MLSRRRRNFVAIIGNVTKFCSALFKLHSQTINTFKIAAKYECKLNEVFV